MEVINAVIKPVAETLMVPVRRHLGYLIYCRKYVRDMRNKLNELIAARIGVEEHMNHNTSSLLEVPAQVRGWLEDVGKINAKVEEVPSDVGSCFALKIRHRVGRKAFKMIEEIEIVTRKHSLITWTDHPITLGKVNSMTPSTDHDDFKSRERIFTEALQALHPNHKSHMIALCGMGVLEMIFYAVHLNGGVGKTTMMQRLKKVVQEKKMFSFIVEAVIGQKTDPIAIQEAVADYLSLELKEKTKSARADKLRKTFLAKSDGGKNKFLVILDDVWQFVDLNDIGLSPLPNQGVDFKVLLTSRDEDICTMMGVEASSIVNMKILPEGGAQSFFRQFVAISDDVDPQLYKMGEDIVRKCCDLPIAIKTMALTLKNKSKDAWKDALSRLEHHGIHHFVNEVFGISYDYLQDEETKSIFLLCGLFPEDLDIPTEDLVRYGWGLNLFKKVYTIREARTRLNTCIERLIHTNLLMEGGVVGCVKMHDLALAFVMDMFSKVEHASIVNHGSMSGWPENYVSGPCHRISLTCKGMSEFPKDLMFPNLSILKLMHGDKFLMFPENFYGDMEKLQVVSYHEMKYPLLPSSPQCSTTLRVLHLHECQLMPNCSSIGNLLNLEVLSFAKSGIKWLPSAIGNLKKLRLLDLTDCFGLRIDKGVLKNLVKLEELYLRVIDRDRQAINFTDDNFNEMAELSKNLYALEFEFFENNAQPNNMSFEKLERFKISLGRSIRGDNLLSNRHSFVNTLKLVTDKGELLESRMNELFEKTEVLCLSVGIMNDLEDVEVKSLHPPRSSSFSNIRVLFVSKCADLRYLFTLSVALALSKLDHLEVYECDNIEELIHTEGSGEDIITFPKLKFLSLRRLRKLSGLCHNFNIIELPQLVKLELHVLPKITSIYHKNKLETSCLMKEEVGNLEKLHIYDMENLKEIWPCEFSTNAEVKLKEIEVSFCDNLVNLFPSNPMPFLHHLEELKVMYCGFIEELFKIDLDCVSEIYEEGSNLRRIKVTGLQKLREVWRIKGENNSHLLIRGFQAVESIQITSCKRFRNVSTSATTKFDVGALMRISIHNCGENHKNNESVESSQEQINVQIKFLSKEETCKVSDTISNVVIPSSLIHSFHNLRKLELSRYKGVEAVFEIESPRSKDLVTTIDNQRLLPYLKNLDISSIDNMSHVWKCNWNKFLILQKQQSESPFHNLTTIHVNKCNNIKYLFSPLMAKLLSNLKKVQIEDCDGIEEVVSNRDDEHEEKTTSTHASTTLLPCLDSLTLIFLRNLKCISGACCANGGNNEISSKNSTTTTAFVDQSKFSQVGGVSWTLCQYSRQVSISFCHALSSVIPSYAIGQMQKLQTLKIKACDGLKDVFETQDINSGCHSTSSMEGNCGTPTIPRLNDVTLLKLPNLKILEIIACGLLEHILTFSALESLGQLEELTIQKCKAMKVIVKEEQDGDQTAASRVVVFPRLKSIVLVKLPKLMGFFLGTNDFHVPSLDSVMIKDCPQMVVFTSGQLTAPKLKHVQTGIGTYSLECGLNFHLTTTGHHQTPLQSLDSTGSSSSATTSKRAPWSYQNLIKLHVNDNESVEKVIPSTELLQLQNLEKIHVENSFSIEEVFEALKGTNSSGFDKSQTVVKLPNLTEVMFDRLYGLRHIWKCNQWTIFEFPNLTRLSIQNCYRLKHVFTSSMFGSLLQLKELHIYECDDMEEVILQDANVIVEKEEEESDGKRNAIILPRLTSLSLERLPLLKGFSLGKNDFSFPLLDTLIIKRCPNLTSFTGGNSATPKLIKIETRFGSVFVEEDINSFIKIKYHYKKNPK